MEYRKYIESFPDFPKSGVEFWDFTGILNEPKIFKNAIIEIAEFFQNVSFNKIVAIESKGFIIGSALALYNEKPLILIRKPDLIPGKVHTEKFVKEYGSGEYQIKQGVLSSEDKVLIVYDILAAAGAALAAIQLVKSQNALVAGCAFMIELEYLKAREKLKEYKIHSLIKIPNSNNNKI